MGSLFKSPKPPKIEPPAPMPEPDDEQVEAARRRKIAQQMGRSGRASTIMTDFGNDRGGGQKLGG